MAPPKADHLGDATSFDVAVRYTTRSGEPALAAIETKLTEPFSPTVYGRDPGDPRTEVYRSVARKSRVWIDTEDPSLTDSRWNQVWRNHLLVESIRQHEPGLLGAEIVVHHPLDDRCANTCAAYRQFLTDPGGSFDSITIDEIVATWRGLVTRPAHKRWLKDFAARYINLDLSQ
jgi:hypothetical protein